MYSNFTGIRTPATKQKTNNMGTAILMMGTLCAVLLQLLPADMEQSEKQLTDKSQPVITVDPAYGSITTPQQVAFVAAEITIQVADDQPRVHNEYVEEDKGNIQDGFTLHEPAPT
jgi:hypothetical protein